MARLGPQSGIVGNNAEPFRDALHLPIPHASQRCDARKTTPRPFKLDYRLHDHSHFCFRPPEILSPARG